MCAVHECRAVTIFDRSIAFAGAAMIIVTLSACAGASLPDAASRGDVAEIKKLATGGGIVNQPRAGAGTPLYDAIRGHQPAAVQALIDLGADVNWKPMDADGKLVAPYPPLYFAATRAIDSVPESIAIVEILVAAGADTKGAPLSRPLIAAIEKNSTDGARILIAHGALTPDAADDAMDLAAMNANAVVFDLLVKAGTRPHGSTADKEGTLFAAIRGGNPAVVDAVLRHGASATDSYRSTTVLSFAAEFGTPDIVDIVVRHNAVDRPDSQGLYAVHNAARTFNFDIAATLLNRGEPARIAESGLPEENQYDDVAFLKDQLSDPLPHLLAAANLSLIKGDKAIDRGNGAQCAANFRDASRAWEQALGHFTTMEQHFAHAATMRKVRDVAIGIAASAALAGLQGAASASAGQQSAQIFALTHSTNPSQYFHTMSVLSPPSAGVAFVGGAIGGAAAATGRTIVWAITRRKLPSFAIQYRPGMENNPEILQAIFLDRRDVSKKFLDLTQASAQCCQDAGTGVPRACHADLAQVLTSK
jgi:ankyrin repeat protein